MSGAQREGQRLRAREAVVMAVASVQVPAEVEMGRARLSAEEAKAATARRTSEAVARREGGEGGAPRRKTRRKKEAVVVGVGGVG